MSPTTLLANISYVLDVHDCHIQVTHEIITVYVKCDKNTQMGHYIPVISCPNYTFLYDLFKDAATHKASLEVKTDDKFSEEKI